MKYLTICLCLGLAYAIKTEELTRNPKDVTKSKIEGNKEDSKKVKRYGINLDGTFSNYYGPETIQPININARIPYESGIPLASDGSSFGFGNSFPGFQNDFSSVNIGSERKYPTVLQTNTNNGFNGISNFDRSYDSGLRSFQVNSYPKLQETDILINSALNQKSGVPVSIEQARLEFSQEANGRASQFLDTASSSDASKNTAETKTQKRSFTIEQVPEVSSIHRSGPLVASDIPSLDELNKIFESAEASKVSSKTASTNKPKLEEAIDDDAAGIEERIAGKKYENIGTVHINSVGTNINGQSNQDNSKSFRLAASEESDKDGSIIESRTNEKDENIDNVFNITVQDVTIKTSKLPAQDNSEAFRQTIPEESKSAESEDIPKNVFSDTLTTIDSSFSSDNRNNALESESKEKANEPSILELITMISSNPVQSDTVESRNAGTDTEQTSDDITNLSNNNSGIEVDAPTSKLSDQDKSESLGQTIPEESKSSESENISNNLASDALTTINSYFSSDDRNNTLESEPKEKPKEPTLIELITTVSSNPEQSNAAVESRNAATDTDQTSDDTSNLSNNNSGIEAEALSRKVSAQDKSGSIDETILEQTRSSGTDDITNNISSDTLTSTTSSFTPDNTDYISKSEPVEKPNGPSILDFFTMVSSNPSRSEAALELGNSETDIKQTLDNTANSGIPLNNLDSKEAESNYEVQTSEKHIISSENIHSENNGTELETISSETTISPDSAAENTRTETELSSTDVESAAKESSPTATEKVATTTEAAAIIIETVSTVIDTDTTTIEAITTTKEAENSKTEAAFTSMEFNTTTENS